MKFLAENKRKLKFIGRLPWEYDEILARFNDDGTISAINSKDRKSVKEINKTIEELKKHITPLIDYIKNDIFQGMEILSQELVISNDKKVLALCDLSNENSILEIKTYGTHNLDKLKYQLYYESNNRDCYIMNIDWSKLPKKITFIISKVDLKLKNITHKQVVMPKDDSKKKLEQEYKNNMKCDYVELLDYSNLSSRYSLVKLHCKKCNEIWNATYEKD